MCLAKHIPLEKAEFVIVQELFLSETAKFATVVLPAASFAEKEGTFTNNDRRIQIIQKAIEPDANSFTRLGNYL
jgi:predicted molibdopterin-dependent oxidoreductase YjgC